MGPGTIEEALRGVVAARAALADLERALVVQGREQGASWAQLAAPLGISKQAVRQRHVAVDPIAAQRPRRLTDEEYRDRVFAWARANGHAR